MLLHYRKLQHEDGLKSAVYLPVLMCSALLLASCGGGGGGVGPSFNDSGLGGGQAPLDVLPTASSCTAELDAPSSGVSAVIPDLGNGCDYRVTRSMTFRGVDVRVEAGVTFLMDEEASLNFQDSTVTMVGSGVAPIRFQSSSSDTNWRYIRISDSIADLQNVLVSGGGRDASLNGREIEASITLDDTTISMANVSVVDSASAGLHIVGSRTIISRFDANTFGGNATYGLSLGDPSLAGSIGADNVFSPPEDMNGVPVIFLAGPTSFARSQTVLADFGVPYLTVGGRLGGGVLILEGVDIWVEPGGVLELSGSVNVFGTKAEPVTFQVRPGSDGDWGGLIVESRSTVVMRGFVVIGGGSGPNSQGGSISLNPNNFGTSMVTLTDGIIRGSLGWGLFCESNFDSVGEINTTNVDIEDSLAGDIHPSCEIVEGESFNTDQPVVSSTDTIASCAEVLISLDDDAPRILSNTDSSCDYYLVGQNQFSSTVLIEPGTRILFAEQADLLIGGTLTARGTAAEPITLDAERPLEGYWSGLTVGGSQGSVLSHVQIDNGGRPGGAGLRLLGGSISMNDVSVMGSGADGLRISDGIVLNAFSSNILVGNAGAGLVVPSDLIGAIDAESLYDSDMAPNGIRAIAIDSTTPRESASVVLRQSELASLRDLGSPWLFSTLRLESEEGGPAFTIEAGAQILIREGSRLSVRGDLNILGTADNTVKISGYTDAPELWGGMQISSGATQISNAVIQGGGMGEGSGFGFDREAVSGAIQIEGTTTRLNLNNSIIQDSQGWGLNCVRSQPENIVLDGVQFANNALGEINPDCGS